MTFPELLQASANGMPKVKDASGKIGQVVVIKQNRAYSGCAVEFPGVPYDVWFHAEWKEDKRSRYMQELEIIL